MQEIDTTCEKLDIAFLSFIYDIYVAVVCPFMSCLSRFLKIGVFRQNSAAALPAMACWKYGFLSFH